jgi:hypothetical protein
VLPTLRRVLTIGALIICGLLLIYSTSRVSSNVVGPGPLDGTQTSQASQGMQGARRPQLLGSRLQLVALEMSKRGGTRSQQPRVQELSASHQGQIRVDRLQVSNRPLVELHHALDVTVEQRYVRQRQRRPPRTAGAAAVSRATASVPCAVDSPANISAVPSSKATVALSGSPGGSACARRK